MKLRVRLDELKLKYEFEGVYVLYVLFFKLWEIEKFYKFFFYYSFM